MSDIDKTIKDLGIESQPVPSWVNTEHGGQVLSCDRVFEDGLAKIKSLRQQQKEYEDSLPTDEAEAISQAMRLLCPKGESYPEGFEEALYLSAALAPMIKTLEIGEPGPDRDAVLFIADRVQMGLEAAHRKLDRISDTLSAPAVAKRKEKWGV